MGLPPKIWSYLGFGEQLMDQIDWKRWLNRKCFEELEPLLKKKRKFRQGRERGKVPFESKVLPSTLIARSGPMSLSISVFTILPFSRSLSKPNLQFVLTLASLRPPRNYPRYAGRKCSLTYRQEIRANSLLKLLCSSQYCALICDALKQHNWFACNLRTHEYKCIHAFELLGPGGKKTKENSEFPEKYVGRECS